MSDSFVTPWSVASQAPLSMGFPSKEHWSGLPFPSPGDLPDPRSKPFLLHWQVDSLQLSHQRSWYIYIYIYIQYVCIYIINKYLYVIIYMTKTMFQYDKYKIFPSILTFSIIMSFFRYNNLIFLNIFFLSFDSFWLNELTLVSNSRVKY